MPETTPAGATPVVAGATPAQTPPPTGSAPVAPPPATGDDAALGDAGKRAIDAMKAERDGAQRAAKAAERELETMRTASQTDQEKLLSTAKREAAAEERAKFETMLRRAGVRSELRAKGLSESLAELALKDDRFAVLKVDDGGRVTEVDKAVEAFLKDFPEMVTPAHPGTVTAGAQTGAPAQPANLEEAIAAHYKH
jgi:predicted GNAT family acetyltransferase